MKRCLVILFLLLSAVGAIAQDWDEVLDRYEVICGRCAELKSDADAGGNVPQSSLISLYGQLEQLKTVLQQGREKMTPSQEARFWQIKTKFTLLMTGKTPEPADTLSLQSMEPKAVDETIDPTGIQPEEKRKSLQSDLLLEAGAKPFSAGLMADITYGRWGGFIKARTGFHYPKTAYGCTSDGIIQDTGGRIWTSGRTMSTRFSVTAGPVVRVCRWLSADGCLYMPAQDTASAKHTGKTAIANGSRSLTGHIKEPRPMPD